MCKVFAQARGSSRRISQLKKLAHGGCGTRADGSIRSNYSKNLLRIGETQPGQKGNKGVELSSRIILKIDFKKWKKYFYLKVGQTCQRLNDNNNKKEGGFARSLNRRSLLFPV